MAWVRKELYRHMNVIYNKHMYILHHYNNEILRCIKMYAYCISCVLHLIHIYTCILKLCYTELIVHLFPYDSENMIFLVEEKEKKNLGWVFLVNVAGVGLSQGRVCRGVGLSQGCVCRWGAFVVG